MPKIDRYDPLSYPAGYDIQRDATPYTFPEPRSAQELLIYLHEWLTAARWRQGGWMIGARNINTPECGCMLGALAICRLGGKNPHEQSHLTDVNRGFTELLERDELCRTVMNWLHTELIGWTDQPERERLELIRWQDKEERAYSEVIGLIRKAMTTQGLTWERE